MDLFGDSDGDDIPCGQQQNMEHLLHLAEELGSQGHNLEEDLLAPPITAPAPQPQPAPGQPPVFDIALVAALKEATPPPASAARNDTIAFSDNAVPGSNFTEAGCTGCIREETKVSFPLSPSPFPSSFEEA